MQIESALITIQNFWDSKTPFPFQQSDNSLHLERIKAEFNHPLPQMVQEYVGQYAPAERFSFDTVGNPMDVYAINRLKFQQDGYNYNPVKKETIEGWKSDYFIFADEGADPVIIDLRHPEMVFSYWYMVPAAGTMEIVLQTHLASFCYAVLHVTMPLIILKKTRSWMMKKVLTWRIKPRNGILRT